MYLKIVVFYSLSIFSREVHTQSLTHANGWPDFLSLSRAHARVHRPACATWMNLGPTFIFGTSSPMFIWLIVLTEKERKTNRLFYVFFYNLRRHTVIFRPLDGVPPPLPPSRPRDLACPTLQKVKLFSLFSFVCLFVFSSHHKNRQRKKMRLDKSWCLRCFFGTCSVGCFDSFLVFCCYDERCNERFPCEINNHTFFFGWIKS